MAKKLRVGILFGGRSGEHEVSLLSAASILQAIDRTKFDVVPIGITKAGRWLAAADAHGLLDGNPEVVARKLRAGDPEVTPGAKLLQEGMPTLLAPEPGAKGPEAKALDVVFPVLHGTFGEDGTIQGLFELAGIAYVGSGVLGSSAGMDKDVMKRLFAQARLPIVKHVTLLRSDWEKSPKNAVAAIEKALRYPVFVKPANLGSSVGISKAHDRKELGPALTLAAKYDRKLIVEQGVGGKRRGLVNSKSPSSATTIPRPASSAKSFQPKSSTTTKPNIFPKAPYPLFLQSSRKPPTRQFARWPSPHFRPAIYPASRESISGWSPMAHAASSSLRSTRCPVSPKSACTPNSGKPAEFPIAI